MPQVSTKAYDYAKIGGSPFKFALRPFIADPAVCGFQYSCRIIAGARSDLCNIQNSMTSALFDPATGHYQFESRDLVGVQPGDYTFEITGTVGTKSDYITFVLTLVDPCPSIELQINEPDPFKNATYLLGEP